MVKRTAKLLMVRNNILFFTYCGFPIFHWTIFLPVLLLGPVSFTKTDLYYMATQHNVTYSVHECVLYYYHIWLTL